MPTPTVQELNYTDLRWNKLYYYSNRSWELVKKPKRIIPLLVLAYGLHILYYTIQNQPNVSHTVLVQSLFGFLSNVVTFFLIYLALQFIIGLFKGAANYTFVSRFIERNTLKRIGKSPEWWESEPRISDSTKNLCLPSIQGSKQFKLIPQFSFWLSSKQGYQLPYMQFYYEFPYYLPSHFYFMSVCIILKHKKNTPHVYLDSYKNGRSIMRLLKNEALTLEGDFPNFFRIHYKDIDAAPVRELLTPDIMQTLINANEPYDYEFCDDKLWIIAKGYHLTELDLKRIGYVADKLIQTLDKP